MQYEKNLLIEIENKCINSVSAAIDYQLNAEDALTVFQNDLVIFADASQNDIPSFRFSPVSASDGISFTTHAMSPGSVLALCKELYSKQPPAYLLEIRGYSWDLGEPVTKAAMKNLERAMAHLVPVLANPTEEALRSAVC